MIWLIGNKGMLGTELSQLFERQGVPFTGTDRGVDITDPQALMAFAHAQAEPVSWIVNCAAYTAVDNAENDVAACRRLNVDGAGNIASCAKSIGAKLIHISTDYVFDGKGIIDALGTKGGAPPLPRPYREDDPASPIGVYGLSKYDGERAALEKGCGAAVYIIRSAWLYGAHGNNFVSTMLRLMNERDEVKVVNDQQGSPTWARDLAGALLALITAADSGKTVQGGVYHYTDEGAITWFDFAREIYRLGRELGRAARDCAVIPCSSAEYPAKVQRPAYSVLDKSKIKAALGITIPAWDASLRKFLQSNDHTHP